MSSVQPLEDIVSPELWLGDWPNQGSKSFHQFYYLFIIISRIVAFQQMFLGKENNKH